MYNITYISDIDRIRLVVLNDALRSVATVEEQQKIREEISEIESKRKPLHECDTSECTELRTTIWNKFDKLNRTGKYSMAHQFKMMLQQIEIRQAAIYREALLAEAQRKLEEQKEKLEQILGSKEDKREASKNKANAKSVSSRWTSGIGSLD
jgi:hypothetical protein